MVRQKPKILGVIGDPIFHSLSPVMHNAALAALNLPYLYMAFHVRPEELENFIASCKQKGIVGLNVTLPHKQAILPLVHSLSREARLMGAVNTLVFKGNKWIGHNTDGLGYIKSLSEETHFEIEGKHVTLLGAGGTARAIAVACGLAKAREVHFINRTTKKALDLAAELNKKFPHTLYSAYPFHSSDLYPWTNCDLLVNATPMGMKGKKGEKLPLAKLPSHALVSDIVYNPLETSLIQKAKKLKLKTLAGGSMLLYQGALAFELFTQKKAPLSIMKEALMNALTKKKNDG